MNHFILENWVPHTKREKNSKRLNRFLSFYKNAPDINIKLNKKENTRKGNRYNKDKNTVGKPEKGYSRFFINIGKIRFLAFATNCTIIIINRKMILYRSERIENKLFWYRRNKGNSIENYIKTNI